MRRRVPVVATLVVLIAVAAMLALGVWQLAVRLPQKEAYLAQLAANPAKPAIAFPSQPDDTLLFRRASALCREPIRFDIAGAGAAGFRVIAACGQGVLVQLGTTRDFKARPAWRGGAVSGFISHAPDGRSLIGSLFEHGPKRLMLVADTPPAGLAANTGPDISSVPNNHFAYGMQWFLFAGVALIIYALAVRRRSRGSIARRPR